jgi:hypothetical protein
MSLPLLEEVFKRSGLPTHTFVEPAEYNHLKIALRTPGRGVVVEGPSGIGLIDGVTEGSDQKRVVLASIETVKDRVLTELSRTFLNRAIDFARGRRFRREGRAPYLHLLVWLAQSEEWTCSIDQLLAENPTIRGSVGQVIDKGHLADFLKERYDLSDIFHYDGYTRILAVEDPKLMYFLRNLLWSKFVRQVGFISVEFRSKYDFALSFAGEDRCKNMNWRYFMIKTNSIVF